MIIIIGGIKGGTGKTTIATNLTVLRICKGKKVLLVDADEQQSSCSWALQRELEGIESSFVTIHLKDKAVKTEILKMKDHYDDIIIDVGATNTIGQRAAMTIADRYVLPFQPRSFDIWTLGLVKNLINEAVCYNENLKSIAFINRADMSGSGNADALEVLRESENIVCLPYTVGQRKSFSNAASCGLGVVEMKIKDKKAISEIMTLHDCIYYTGIMMISERYQKDSGVI
jgi:chromosome partitioning protein